MVNPYPGQIFEPDSTYSKTYSCLRHGVNEADSSVATEAMLTYWISER